MLIIFVLFCVFIVFFVFFINVKHDAIQFDLQLRLQKDYKQLQFFFIYNKNILVKIPVLVCSYERVTLGESLYLFAWNNQLVVAFQKNLHNQ